MYIGLLKEGFTWLVWWLACMLLFLAPGWALMEAIWPGWRKLNRAEKLGVSAGVGLAMYPLILLWTQAVGLQLGWLYAWLPASISLAWLAWRHRTEIISLGRVRADLYINLRRMVLDGSLLLIVVIGLIIYSRFWTIRRVDLPMWGDSYQHAMMAQLILDNHGLFSTWQPYSPYYSLSVHFGFPAQSAVFGWMLGKDGATAALVFGQAVNILAVLTLLPLALRLSRGSLWAGAAALIAAGLIFQVPAYYVNWGRYAQLGGQAIFPVAAWLTWDALSGFNDRAGIPGRRVMAWMSILLLTGSVIAGALLTYYRMAYFYFTFMVIWGLAFALPSFRLHWGRWGTAVTVAAGIAVSSLLWLLPWYPHTQKSHLSEVVEVGMAIRRPIDFVLADLKAWNDAWEYYPQALTVILLLALVWGLIRRQWMIPGLIAWIAFLAAYTFGQLLQLPAANLLTNFSILIAVYIPASLIIGWLVGDFAGWMQKKSILGAALLGLALFVMALYGANQVRNVANMDTFSLVNRPDQRAASWIGENIPAEARILVEGFTIYGGSTAVGADGGWWLPLLVKRENTMPPQYALMNEVPHPASYSKDVVVLVRELEATAPGSAEGLRLLCENRITHVYIGQTQGKTGSPARQLYKPEDFLKHPAFEKIYHQDRVYLFALRAGVCPNR
jgi:hypothetical protein